MRILLLAPQPFYQERGTPIAIRLLLETLSARGHTVDMATFPEGEAVTLPGLTIFRTPDFRFLRGIRPGFSLRKLVCDAFLLYQAFRLAARHRYHLVHAVEEAAGIALLLKVLFRLPYLYDMDSSLAQQMIEKFPRLRWIGGVLNVLEALLIRQARVVMPVCDHLSEHAAQYQPEALVVLYDVPLLNGSSAAPGDNLRDDLPSDSCLVLYVGNLEAYQGIDLLLDAFALAKARLQQLELVIIGGQPSDIDHYQRKAASLNIRVLFTGAKPLAHLAGYLAQADVLASPRIKGTNTPMKLYSYMDSGKPILATDSITHTQVLDSSAAVLTVPTPAAYAEGMVRLAHDTALRERVGTAAKALIADRYSHARFHATFTALIDQLARDLASEDAV